MEPQQTDQPSKEIEETLAKWKDFKFEPLPERPVDPNKPQVVIPSREEHLKQKFEAMKQLSIINDTAHKAKQRVPPSEYPCTCFIGWVYKSWDAVERVRKEIDGDIECGCFGIKSYMLMELDPTKNEDKQVENIVNALAEHFPKACLVVDNAGPVRILYNPSN